MASLPSQALRRASVPSALPANSQQVRHASLLRRPKRPYTFTQLVTLSDGSTFTQRTTSPRPVLKLQKDTRNHPMWNPSLMALQNTEEDFAGRLRAFRKKFGRGWDSEMTEEAEDAAAESQAAAGEQQEESLLDLLSGYAANNPTNAKEMTSGKIVKKKK